MILIITNRNDIGADYQILYLQERGIPYFRFNADQFPEDAKVVYEVGKKGVRGTLHCGKKSTQMGKISVIWYRRLLLPPDTKVYEPAAIPYVRHESRHFLEGVFYALPVPWVNPLHAVYIGERKLYQLKVAKECGFRIPETVVSTDRASLKKFVKKHEQVVCKPVYSGLQLMPGAQGGGYSVYTHIFRPEHLEDEVGVRHCPTYLQQLIDKVADIRVTIFGERLYAVSIKGKQGLLDWRRPGTKLTYSNTRLSDEMTGACHRLLERLGLVYGALDFVIDHSGKYYFLEINPAGEWAWLDRELQLDMRRALVELFEKLRGTNKWHN